jgi:endonuclease YncB( thermonuclease family)
MTSLLHPILLPILLLLAAPATRPAEEPPPVLAAPDLSSIPLATVLGVADADQITVHQQEGIALQVRLAYIQVPSQDARQAAMVFLRNLLAGEKVWLVPGSAGPNPKDTTYYVYRAPDKLFVNLEAVRQGYADVLPEPSSSPITSKAIAYWRDHARCRNRGIWATVPAAGPAASQPALKAPASAAPASQLDARAIAGRAPSQPQPTIVYVSSSPSGKKYHLAGCKSLRSPGKPVPLDEARKTYEPCKQCDPPK